MFPTEEGWKLYDTVNVLNAMELYMLKWLILCCVNFTSKKKKNPQNQETTHTVHPIIAGDSRAHSCWPAVNSPLTPTGLLGPLCPYTSCKPSPSSPLYSSWRGKVTF